MNMDSIKLRVPATTSNLGSCMEIVGLALKEPFDVVEVEKIAEGVVIESKGYDIPIEPRKNTGGHVAIKMLQKFGIKEGVKIKIDKMVKPAMGLGSSGTTPAAVAYAINELFELKLTTIQIIDAARYGEIISAGVPHPDNVAASIVGNFVIVPYTDPNYYEIGYYLQFDPPENMGIVIVMPSKIEKGSTKLAKEAIPREVPLRSAYYNIGQAAVLSAGISSKNLELIKKGMDDAIVEPARVRYGIFRELPRMKKLGKELNAGISGSGAGPSILGIIEKERCKELADGMKEIFGSHGYSSDVIITEAGEGIKKS